MMSTWVKSSRGWTPSSTGCFEKFSDRRGVKKNSIIHDGAVIGKPLEA